MAPSSGTPTLTGDQRLTVGADGRRLLRADGTPFFYLGDTAWQLFHGLTREEAEHYLSVRADQGFNVIQAVILAEFDGLRTPNAYGHFPLHDCDPARPNEAYFEHVDWVIAKGVEKGLWWGLLPTWGDKWFDGWGRGPVIFTAENARPYGEWLGRRYRDVPLLWILGGDRAIQNDGHLTLMRAMAEGLHAGDGGAHLRSFHPWGGASSSQWLHDEPWLDFNMLQSGHTSRRLDNHRMIAADYGRTPAKPCIDAEPVYENHPDMAFDVHGPAPYFGELAVRRAAWQAVFAGAFGHTYGCHDIWQFHGENRPPHNRARTPWETALHLPGAEQIRHLKAFFEQLPFSGLVPDNSLASTLPSGEPVQVLSTNDRTLALFYFPNPGARTLCTGSLPGKTLAGFWFDPATGQSTDILPFANSPLREWSPPSDGTPDRVLVLQPT